MMDCDEARKGAIPKIFGVILIFLGILDSMLSWRGGFALNSFYVFLMASGAFLYFIGAVRQGREPK
jgi:multisubunit Na+/H+ antiporter MnhG subunit